MTEIGRSCWCGAHSLEEFGPNYLRCSVCETLVGQAGLADEQTLVGDDEVDYYGKRYWLEHQRDGLSLPDIHVRVRDDLPERCVHWLKALLRYRKPPARVLEVGAGHGAYTALLRWAGYEATALDLSAWVAEYSRGRFGIPYLVGPIEEQDLGAGSFDIVVANDVLEHLADPEETVRRWAEVLRPDGVLVIQTPEYPSGQSYEELVAGHDLFVEHMRASTEHLYLFSRPALELLLARVGLAEVAFHEPVYAYDMFCVAGAAPLVSGDDDGKVLEASSAVGPLVLALVDAHDAGVRLDAALKESDADRQARLDVIERLDAALRESEADREAQAKVIAQQRGIGEHLRTGLRKVRANRRGKSSN